MTQRVVPPAQKTTAKLPSSPSVKCASRQRELWLRPLARTSVDAVEAGVFMFTDSSFFQILSKKKKKICPV